MQRKYPGYLISVEGLDGAGKTEALKAVIPKLSDRGFKVVSLREPGGTRIGEKVRSILKDPENSEMSHRTETLLFQAPRAQIVDEIVIPELKSGSVVILDRFKDSSLVYQGYVRKLGVSWVNKLNDFSTQGLDPDLTLFFSVNLDNAIERLISGGEMDRLDREGIKFHKDAEYAYLTLLAHDNSGRWEIIDANQTKEGVARATLGCIESHLFASRFIERPLTRKEGR